MVNYLKFLLGKKGFDDGHQYSRNRSINRSCSNEKDISRDIKALLYDIYGVVDAGTFELLRQYRGGFAVHILNFIQFFSVSPYSAKEWKRKYSGYKETY